MIIGGFAVIASGVPRQTIDIDAVLLGRTHLQEIDLQRIRNLIVDIASALDDPQRIDAFDAMVARARRSV